MKKIKKIIALVFTIVTLSATFLPVNYMAIDNMEVSTEINEEVETIENIELGESTQVNTEETQDITTKEDTEMQENAPPLLAVGDWFFAGLEENTDIYLSNKEGKKLSIDFSPEELSKKLEEYKDTPKLRWSANAGETTSYLTSGGYDIIVPIIRRSDNNSIVACMQSGAYHPSSTDYDGLGNPYHNENILGIMYYGDVNNGVPALAQKYGLDWYYAHNGWQTALWSKLNDLGYPVNPYQYDSLQGNQNLINYINELKSQSFSNAVKNFTINFDGVISQADPQKTNPMSITEKGLSFSVSVNNSKAYVTDLDGVKRTNFNSGDEFKVIAPADLIGKVTVTVHTEQIKFTTLIYRATINGVQDLGQIAKDDPVPLNKDIELNFKGALWGLEIQKLIDNHLKATTVPYDFTQFSFKVDSPSLGYGNVFQADAKGKISIPKELIYAEDWGITEVSVPYGVTKDTKRYPITPTPNETYKYKLTNPEIPAWLNFIKNDVNGGFIPNVYYRIATDVLKNSDGSYKLDKDGNPQIDEKTVIPKEYKTAINGEVLSDSLPSGLRNVWVQEVKTPAHVIIDDVPRLVKLEENKTTTVHYLNNLVDPFQIEGFKTDEFGKPLADMIFDIVDLSTKKVVATVRTDSRGYFISPILQRTDIYTRFIDYELREQAHPLFKPLKAIKFNGKDIDSHNMLTISPSSLINHYKELVPVLPKTLETNVYNLTAENVKFDLKNNGLNKVVSSATVKNNLATFTPYKANQHTNGKMVYYEVDYPYYIVQDKTVYEMPHVDLSTYVSGTPIYLREASDPLVNKLVPPKIGTTLTTDKNGKEVEPNEKVKLVDTVKYEKLIIGKVYTLKAILMDKTTGLPLQVDGKEVKAETIFTPTKANGSVDVTFEFIAKGLDLEQELVAFEYLNYNGKEVTVHTDINDKGQTVKVKPPKIGTTATYADGTKVTKDDAVTTLVDKVAYTGLTVGKEYVLKGILMNKKTNTPLLINGEQVIAQTTFKPTKSSGIVDVTFEFDTLYLEEQEIVAFETLYRDDIEIAVHTDITDKGQTVEVEKPEIGTTATWENGEKTTVAGETIKLVDTVKYCGISIGKEYKLNAVLMDKQTSEPLIINDVQVIADALFTPTEECGEVQVIFEFNTSGLAGKELVVFESLTREDIEITTHADINDKGQTVEIKPPLPVTGESTNVVIAFASLLLLISGAVILYTKRKARDA